MKKIYLLFFLTCLLVINVNIVFAEASTSNNDNISSNYNQEINKITGFLDKLGILNIDKMNEKDYISRRDVLKMVYAVRTGGGEYVISPQSIDAETLLEYKMQNSFNGYDGYKTYFDIESGSEDDYLIMSAEVYNLFKGEKQNDKWVARLDDCATYCEVLTFISYLFSDTNRIPSIDTGFLLNASCETYYDFAENIGLINATSNIDIASPHICLEQKHIKIPAYECFNLIYRALYIPHTVDTGWGASETYYINKFL